MVDPAEKKADKRLAGRKSQSQLPPLAGRPNSRLASEEPAQPRPQSPPARPPAGPNSRSSRQNLLEAGPQGSQSAPIDDDYRLLLTPAFAAMTKITDNLYLTGVGGMTRENFRRNHIDFVVNITVEAPFWEDVESLRLPLDDEPSADILGYLEVAVERINEAIVRHGWHVLVHCVAGVSRSATVVIAYLMKFRRLDLHAAFNHCYNLRPVIRPNNGFMRQLIKYELQLFGRNSVAMRRTELEGVSISLPDFFLDEHPDLVRLEVMRERSLERSRQQLQGAKSALGGRSVSADER